MPDKLFALDRGVIVACDIANLNELERILKSTSEIEGIVGFKIGFSLVGKYGLPTVVRKIKGFTDLPVIYDHQKAGTDIPQMGILFAEICRESGVDGLIIFPQSGPETEKAFISAILKMGLVPLVGGEMTHARYLEKDGGFISNSAVEQMYLHGVEAGAHHFIVPGNKPQRIDYYARLLIKHVSKPRFCMPGIGRQGGDIKSAFEATGGLPAYAIIGSGIYKAHNMRKAATIYGKEALGRNDES